MDRHTAGGGRRPGRGSHAEVASAARDEENPSADRTLTPPDAVEAGPSASAPPQVSRGGRRRRIAIVAVVVAVLGGELALAWPALATALSQFRAPHPGWLLAAVVAEMASMRAYARMQRHLLSSAGIRASLVQHVSLVYAAHSLSVTLPGGPAFSTSFNYRQMRRFGASPGIAMWCIAVSGTMSAAALAVLGVVGGIAANGRPNWLSLTFELGAVLAAAVAIRHLIRHPAIVERVARFADRVIGRLRPGSAIPGPGPAVELLAQLRAVRLRPGPVAAAGAYAIANWVLDALCLWASCLAVGANTVTATQVLIAYCAGMAAGSALPIVPGGLGVIDSALVLGLVAGGLTSGAAIPAVLLYRVISLGFIVCTGWVVWLMIRYRGRRASC